jgi:hypothetical protein
LCEYHITLRLAHAHEIGAEPVAERLDGLSVTSRVRVRAARAVVAACIGTISRMSGVIANAAGSWSRSASVRVCLLAWVAHQRAGEEIRARAGA